ncbi:histidine triad nucleotide-binding protein [Thermogemmatispora onikobensis]|uniref:histidine triad nucleotide-binding protein n=1 Tax=Thermogemmatispora onikobensis TaxID=732234 RepID=UPI0008533F19|nr:histidine triad nucleotide-binding protein [Thermogemmatispora onikobensis]
MQDCLFCKIANGEIPSTILYQDAEVVAFADINPQAPHHVLLIPRRHLASMKEVTEQDGTLLAHLFTVANKLAQDLGLSERGYRFVTNVGPDAGQSVFHLHFHLLGGRPFGWPPG